MNKRSCVPAVLVIILTSSAVAQQKAVSDTTTSQPKKDQLDDPIDILVVGRRTGQSPTVTKAPPRCVKRPNDPADLVHVHQVRTDQRVIAPDKNGVLTWQGDREPLLGPEVWQRAGTGIGQYVFRVPNDGQPMCIGAAIKSPSGWGQLRQIVKVTPDMKGKYIHFSTLVAARDAKTIRFWLVAGASGARVMGGDTHTADLKGTFGWKMADVIVGPVPTSATHLSYGFLLWGRGDVWVYNQKIEFKTHDEVRKIPSLPTSLLLDPLLH